MSTMAVRLNPGNLQSSDALVAWTDRKVRAALRRLAPRITRVEVHVADLNGPKEGKSDLRCAMEVRINGRKPLVVEHRAADLYAAIDGAARKLRTAAGRAVDRVRERANHRSRRDAPPMGRTPAMAAAGRASEVARALSPSVFIAARARHPSEAIQAKQKGADAVTVEELIKAQATAASVADAVVYPATGGSEGAD